MYQLINRNIVNIINIINRSNEIEPYLAIMNMFNEGRITDDDFKNTYRKYYQLNAARLSEDYCNHYFNVMENNIMKKEISIKSIVEELYSVPTNSKDNQVIMFSFATKLLHTINNSLPLYDRLVADFYFFPQIKPNWSYEKKLAIYLKIYDFLQNEYMRILDNSLLSDSILKFRNHFGLSYFYTDQKIIDTLLWRFVAFLRNGAVIEGIIKYN